MKLHKESHLDHGLNARQLAHILLKFDARKSFFIETVTLPDDLGTVACGLYGPIMGDRPITDEDTYRERRGDRKYESRMLRSGRLHWDSVRQTKRYVNTVSVIAGPHEEECESSHVPEHGHKLRTDGCDGTGKIDCAGMHAGAAWREETCHKCNGTGRLKYDCILYTTFGGPVSPREPGDIRAEMQKLEEVRREYFEAFQVGKATEELKVQEQAAHAKIIALRPKREESDKFWSEHALITL